MQNTYLGYIFMPKKYLIRVYIESPVYEDDSQPEIQVSPRAAKGLLKSQRDDLKQPNNLILPHTVSRFEYDLNEHGYDTLTVTGLDLSMALCNSKVLD